MPAIQRMPKPERSNQGLCVARHCDGVWSVTFLKLVLKVDLALKPTASLISMMEASVWMSMAQASRIRHWFT